VFGEYGWNVGCI